MQSEIADMIWEVDEDCDQAVNWGEFQAMYHRCNHDQAGSLSAQSPASDMNSLLIWRMLF